MVMTCTVKYYTSSKPNKEDINLSLEHIDIHLTFEKLLI